MYSFDCFIPVPAAAAPSYRGYSLADSKARLYGAAHLHHPLPVIKSVVILKCVAALERRFSASDRLHIALMASRLCRSDELFPALLSRLL